MLYFFARVPASPFSSPARARARRHDERPLFVSRWLFGSLPLAFRFPRSSSPFLFPSEIRTERATRKISSRRLRVLRRGISRKLNLREQMHAMLRLSLCIPRCERQNNEKKKRTKKTAEKKQMDYIFRVTRPTILYHKAKHTTEARGKKREELELIKNIR